MGWLVVKILNQVMHRNHWTFSKCLKVLLNYKSIRIHTEKPKMIKFSIWWEYVGPYKRIIGISDYVCNQLYHTFGPVALQAN